MRRPRPEDFTEEELETSDELIWRVLDPAYDILNNRVRRGAGVPTPEEAEDVMQRVFSELLSAGEMGPFVELERLRGAVSARLDQLQDIRDAQMEDDPEEYLAESLLRSLIRENLQDPEREHFGFTPEGIDALVGELLQYFKGEWTLAPVDLEIRQIQRKFGLPVEFIADGNYRITFGIGRDLVLKVSKDLISTEDAGGWGGESGHGMNLDDYKLGVDPALGGITPRAYLRARDGAWVVLERVAPLESTEQFLSFFRSPLLPPAGDLDEEIGGQVVETLRIVLEILTGKQSGTERPDDPLEMHLGPDAPQLDATLEALGRDLLRRSAPFRGLVKLLTRYNVSLDEIISQYGYGVQLQNLGLGSDGRLVLLDSSIFPGR